METDLSSSEQIKSLGQYRSNITSQSGEDGIIAKIFDIIGTGNRVCVDVGAFDLATYSNTYHLWKDHGWRAVLVEGNAEACARISRGKSADDKVTLVNRYVTVHGDDSMDSILARLSVPEDFDLLSIDVDGIDYHIWRSMTRFKPRVVVIEFNPTIPPHLAIVGSEHGNYVGASAQALLNLGLAKGYGLVACTALNAIFVVADECSGFPDVNDLPTLFDYSGISYVMTSFDGGPFHSLGSLPFGYNPFSREVRAGLGPDHGYHVPSDRLSHYVLLWLRERARRLKRRIVKPPALGPVHR